jgi:hypothetical protein
MFFMWCSSSHLWVSLRWTSFSFRRSSMVMFCQCHPRLSWRGLIVPIGKCWRSGAATWDLAYPCVYWFFILLEITCYYYCSSQNAAREVHRFRLCARPPIASHQHCQKPAGVEPDRQLGGGRWRSPRGQSGSAEFVR